MQAAEKKQSKGPEEFKSERGFDTLMGEDELGMRPNSAAKSSNSKLGKQKSLKRTKVIKSTVVPKAAR